METSIIPVEGNPAPKSTGSLVQISSIYIDLKIPVEKNETESCQHNFSILGYAAETRMKNPKASTPFASDGNLNDIEGELPPLGVPKFRWWRCPECRRKIENTGATKETNIHPNCCTKGLKSTGTSLKVPSQGDAAVVPSGTQQVPTAQRSEGIRNVDINAPPSTICFHDSQLSIGHQEANDAETGNAAAIGGDTGPAKPVIDNAGDIGHEETIAQIGVAPLQVEECRNASSESDQNRKRENSGGVSRRKTKMRYLTDLLNDKGNLRSDLTREDDSSIHSKLLVSSGPGPLVSQDQASCENIGKVTKSPERKRKMPQEEPEGITDPSIIGTNDSMSKADSERTVMDPVDSSERQDNASSGVRPEADSERTVTDPVSSSEGQDNASTGVSLQIGNKNDRGKNDRSMCKSERTPALVKRKNKRIQVHDRFSLRPGEQSSKNNIKQSDLRPATANTLFMSMGTSSAAGKTDNHCRNSPSPQAPESERGDVAQAALQIPKFQPSHLRVGLDLLLNSFAKKIDSSVNKRKASTSKSVLETNDLHFGQCSVFPAAEPDLLRGKSQVWDLNGRIVQNSTNLLEKRNFSLPKKMSSNKEKTSEVQGPSKEINRQSDQRAGNRIARGPSDDIPREIVELMAKNQYERGLPGLSSISPANARSELAIEGSNAGAAKGNSINYSQMNRNRFEVRLPEKNKVSIFNMFPENRQILSRGMQHPASASVRTRSQRSQRAETLSSSTAPNMSFGLGMQQTFPAQKPKSQHRGITIRDIKADELKKAFAPYIYHPRHSTTERRDFLGGFLFRCQNGLGTGTFSIGESSGRSSGQPFAFSGQPQGHDQSYLARYASCFPFTGQTSSQGKDKQKAILGASHSIPYMQQHRGRRLLSVEGASIAEEAQPLRSIPPEEDSCVINRNPAEFTLPDAGNAYTICGEDPKFPKRKYSREMTREGAKRQRVSKPKAGKEQPPNPSS